MVSRLGRLVGLAAKLRELSRFARAYKGVPGAGAGAGAGEGGVVRAVSSRAGVISSPERLRFERYWREWNFESGRNRLSELVRLVFRRLGGWEGFEKLKMKRVSRLETVGTSSLLNSVGMVLLELFRRIPYDTVVSELYCFPAQEIRRFARG
uniref:Uncharacterized protein n=1 Tax=Rhodosorus marinus TaxID=101924 RepID=A0A7S2ZAU7_9RHOD|mmetsp:Transcript_12445/g.50859  ORF Transcript_12445/g.50859 Transcript_12445/m.50859 type:complete len:152 (+) Transcript_12445:93-548(+)